VPSFSIAHMEVPTAGNPYRIKGGGEGGVVPATAALINALCDALSNTRSDFAMPIRTEDVWQAVQSLTR